VPSRGCSSSSASRPTAPTCSTASSRARGRPKASSSCRSRRSTSGAADVERPHRLETRFLATPSRVPSSRPSAVLRRGGRAEKGLVTFTPDEIDWDDEVRIAIEERASLSPDALTGMEASLRFAGPETMETKIFGRLSAWQNWIFPAPQRGGRARSAHPVRTARAARVRLEENVSAVVTSGTIPNNVDLELRQEAAARPRGLAAALRRLVEEMGPEGFQEDDVYLRTAVSVDSRGLGALRLREDARLSLGHLPRGSGPRPEDRLRRLHGQPVWRDVPGEHRNACAGSSSRRATPSRRASSSSACWGRPARACTTSATCSR
jgi:hypothetical protein